MPIELNGITGTSGTLGSIGRGIKTAASGGADANAFAESLNKLVESVDKTATDANVAVTNMVNKEGDVHEAMIALQKAETSLQLTVQVRNTLVQAYPEIMRMPV